MNAAFETKNITVVLTVAELLYLRSLAAKQGESLSNYIRLTLGLECRLVGRPTPYERQVREDQAMLYLKKAGLNDEQIALYFSDIELPECRPKPKVEHAEESLPIPTEGPLSTQQLLALGVMLNDYTARCRAAEAAGEEKPEPPLELQRYLKNRSV
jgi:hypothetical protein